MSGCAATRETYLSFDYDPGGFTNIMHSFENMVILAIVMNRTLVIPPAKPLYLLNFGPIFHGKPVPGTSSIDEFYDWTRLTRFVRTTRAPPCDSAHVVDVNPFTTYFADGPAVDRESETLRANRRAFRIDALVMHPHIRIDTIKNRYLPLPDAVFVGRRASDIRRIREIIRDAFAFSEPIMRVAEAIIRDLPQPFASAHVRRNDLQYKHVFVSANQTVSFLARGIPRDTALYLSTDEVDPAWHATLRKAFSVYRMPDWVKETVDPRFWGCVEQVVASRGIRVFGTEASTFSGYTHRMNGYRYGIHHLWYHHKPPVAVTSTDPLEYMRPRATLWTDPQPAPGIPRVAYVVPVARVTPQYLKQACVLSRSIGARSADDAFDRIAVAVPDVATKAFEECGFRVLRRTIPVALSDIQDPITAKAIARDRNGEGIGELLKFYVFQMTQYHRVVLLDVDTLLLRDIGHLWRYRHVEADAMYVDDWALTNRRNDVCVQGGFGVFRPNPSIFDKMVKTVRTERHVVGKGWGGRFGWYYAGVNWQGLIPYLFSNSSRVVRLNHCIYDSMGDMERDDPPKRWRAHLCHNLARRVRLFHFTYCQKPTSAVKKETRICKNMHREWDRYALP